MRKSLFSSQMNAKSTKEDISNLIPIFKHPEARLLAVETVLKVGKQKNLSTRTLIVGTPGIYLIKKQGFPRSLKVSNSMSLFDLVSIQIAGQTASFSTRQSQIRIQCESINKISFLVYFVRQALFSTSLLPISIHFPSEAQFKVSPESMPYKAQNVFIDRVFACMSHLGIDATPAPFLFKDMQFNETFNICPERVQSPIFPAVILALAFEDSCHSVLFSRVSLAQVLPHCSALFCINRFVTRVGFISAGFQNAAAEFEKVLASKHIFQAGEYAFIECTIDSHSFIESLKGVGSKITKLIFKKCKFTNKSITNIFQTIFFNPCFHGLTSFSIDETPDFYDLEMLVVNLGCCSWATDYKCIHHLSFSFDQIPAAKILTQLFNFDIGLNKLELQKASITQPISILSSPQNLWIHYVDLSYSSFSSESLVSLFAILQKEVTNISYLKLNQIAISDSEMTRFLESVQNMVLPSVCAFDFNHNRLDSDQAVLFAQFLSRQRKLKNISLNSSISNVDSPDGIGSIISVLGNMELDSILLNNEDNEEEFNYGLLVVPLLHVLCSKGTIKFLGLLNQNIQTEGISCLMLLLDQKLEQLLIDNCGSPNIDMMMVLCHKMLSQLTYSTFPMNEFKRLIEVNHIDLDSNDDLHTQLTELESQFQYKTKSQREIEKDYIKNLLASKASIKPSTSNTSLNDYVSTCFNNVSELTKRSPEVESLLRECVDIDAPGFVEPIISLVEEFDEKLSFRSIYEFIEI